MFSKYLKRNLFTNKFGNGQKFSPTNQKLKILKRYIGPIIRGWSVSPTRVKEGKTPER